MNAEEIIANARSKGWRIEKTGKGKDARFRAYCHDGRSTAAPTTIKSGEVATARASCRATGRATRCGTGSRARRTGPIATSERCRSC